MASHMGSLIRALLVAWMMSRGCSQTQRTKCFTDEGINGPILDCQNLNLIRVPRNLPSNTTNLNLAWNSMVNITWGSFTNYPHLVTLVLSHNAIQYIADNAFRDLYSLEELYLSHNQIMGIREQAFHHLTDLRELYLINNPIQYIDPSAFRLMPNLTKVDFKTISMECSCDTLALRNWADNQSPRVDLVGLVCDNFGSTMLSSVQAARFGVCSGELEPAQCLECTNASSRGQCQRPSKNVTCPDPKAVCGMIARVTAGHLSLSSGCQSLSSCTTAQQLNSVNCRMDQTASCQLCCASPNCNYYEGYIGYSIVMKQALYFELAEEFIPELADPTSEQFTEMQTYINEQVRSVVNEATARGRHIVTANSFRPGSGSTVCDLLMTSEVGVGRGAGNLRDAVMNALLQAELEGTIDLQLVPGSLQLSPAGKCEAEEITTPQGHFSWPSLTAQSMVSLPCPAATQVNITRKCLAGDSATFASWEQVNYQQCPRLSGATSQLQDLTRIPVNNDTVPNIAPSLATLSNPGDALVETDVEYTAQVIENIVRASETVISPMSAKDLLRTINNLLQTSDTSLSTAQRVTASTTRLVRDVEQLGDHILFLGLGSVVLVEPQVAIAVVGVPPIGQKGVGFRVGHSKGMRLGLQDDEVEVVEGGQAIGTRQGEVLAALDVPVEVLQRTRVDRLQFTAYTSQRFFQIMAATGSNKTGLATLPVVGADGQAAPIAGDGFTTQLYSVIISASLPDGLRVYNLTQPVVITLKHTGTKAGKNPRCVWWDFEALAGLGAWSTLGCQVAPSSLHDVTVCHCNHLTNFALLMDIYGTDISSEHQRALAIISDVGCGVSLAGLCLTLVTYIIFRQFTCDDRPVDLLSVGGPLRRERPAQILIHLCCALLLMVVTFILSTQTFVIREPILCKVMAALLHFSALATLGWMCVEAFYMYLALVKVFHTHYPHFMLKCSAIGWGIPLLVAIITVAINIDNYGPQANSQLCWLSRIPFYAAFLGPALFVLLLNGAAFSMVIWRLCTLNSPKLPSSQQQTGIGTRLRGALGILVLLGLTWGFAIFAVGGASLVFTYLFAIFNSLQGLFVFIFHCVLKADVRRCWLELLGCKTRTNPTLPSKGSGGSGATTGGKTPSYPTYLTAADSGKHPNHRAVSRHTITTRT